MKHTFQVTLDVARRSRAAVREALKEALDDEVAVLVMQEALDCVDGELEISVEVGE